MTFQHTLLIGLTLTALALTSCEYDKDLRTTGPDVAWARGNSISTNGMVSDSADARLMSTRSSASMKGIEGFTSDREPTPEDLYFNPVR